MNLPRRITLTGTFNFNKLDLQANREGRYSEEQQRIVLLLGKAKRDQRRALTGERGTTQSVPQVQTITGRVLPNSNTRFIPGSDGKAGYFVESFYILVHAEDRSLELPVNQDAMNVFEPDVRYTVFYYLNGETPTFLSATRA